MGSLEIGLRALLAHQRAMDVIGHNIANATTEGYSRQRAEQAPSLPAVSKVGGGYVGTGVEVRAITRSTDALLASRIRERSGVLASAERRDGTLRELEQLLAPDGKAEIPSRLSDAFGALRGLANDPSDPALRSDALAKLDLFTGAVREQAETLLSMREAIAGEAQDVTARANDLLEQVASLNEQIGAASLDGSSPNDLLDERDRRLRELSEIVDVDVRDDRLGMVTVRAGGTLLVSGPRARSIALTRPEVDRLELQVTGDGEPVALTVRGGRLHGLVTAFEQDVSAAMRDLDDFAGELRRALNGVHATGLPVGGGYTTLRASAAVTDPDATLAEAGLAPPIEAGTLTVSVTDEASGAIETSRIAIDPATDSLRDVAARLDGIDGLQAVVDGTGRLQLVADHGKRFDFAGRLSPPPGAPASPVPLTFEGQYTGESNDTLQVVVRGSGEVGVASPLSIELRDAAGDVVASADVGLGYAPGEPIDLGDGLLVRVGAGELPTDGAVIGELVRTAQPDTTGTLAALGVGGLLEGEGALDLAVDERIRSDPAVLAVGRSGRSGDGSNLDRLVAVEGQPLEGLGGATVHEHFGRLLARVGTEARRSGEVLEAQSAVMDALEAERDGVAGVNVDEEMVRLAEMQRAYEAAARYVTVVNDMLTTVMNMVR